MVRIAYITDTYAWDVFGVKRSLYETLATRVPTDLFLLEDFCIPHKFGSSYKIPDTFLFQHILKSTYTHVFFASSGLSFEQHLMIKLMHAGKKLVGFGFSDPRYIEITKQHWHTFDYYFTISPSVRKDAENCFINAGLMLPSIHPSFHAKYVADYVRATHDIVFLGNIATHRDKVIRQTAIKDLRRIGVRVLTIGAGGDIHNLRGEQLLKTLATCRAGLSILDSTSTLPHRIFEYAAVGLCLVSTITPTIAECFTPSSEIVPYHPKKVADILSNIEVCAALGQKARARCLESHTMDNRVNDILERIIP